MGEIGVVQNCQIDFDIKWVLKLAGKIEDIAQLISRFSEERTILDDCRLVSLPLLLVNIIKDYFIRVGDVLVARLDMCFKLKVTKSVQGQH